MCILTALYNLIPWFFRRSTFGNRKTSIESQLNLKALFWAALLVALN